MNNTIGKHIIPRNLYHITDAVSFEKIKADGYLKPRRPNSSYAKEGVFAFELQNALQRWQQMPYRGKTTLLGKLLEITRTSNMVILKIPTKNLDTDKLLIRSQNWYFDSQEKLPKSQIDKLHKFWDDLGDIDHAEKFKKYDELKKSIIEKLFPHIKGHIQNGTSVKEAPLFKQRGEAIEYIYTDKIPLDAVEVAGQANRNDYYEGRTLKVKELLLALFNNRSEKTAVEKVLK